MITRWRSAPGSSIPISMRYVALTMSTAPDVISRLRSAIEIGKEEGQTSPSVVD